jgi:hypothetical protein
VAGAVETLAQHMDKEAADELDCGERHALASIATLDAVSFHLKVTLSWSQASSGCRRWRRGRCNATAIFSMVSAETLNKGS